MDHCNTNEKCLIVTTINPNLKIPNLCRHLLYDSSMDPAWHAGLGDADDEDKDTSLAGEHDEDTSSLAGVPVPNTTIMTNADDDSDAECNHNSVDPNEANDNFALAVLYIMVQKFKLSSIIICSCNARKTSSLHTIYFKTKHK